MWSCLSLQLDAWECPDARFCDCISASQRITSQITRDKGVCGIRESTCAYRAQPIFSSSNPMVLPKAVPSSNLENAPHYVLHATCNVFPVHERSSKSELQHHFQSRVQIILRLRKREVPITHGFNVMVSVQVIERVLHDNRSLDQGPHIDGRFEERQRLLSVEHTFRITTSVSESKTFQPSSRIDLSTPNLRAETAWLWPAIFSASATCMNIRQC